MNYSKLIHYFGYSWEFFETNSIAFENFNRRKTNKVEKELYFKGPLKHIQSVIFAELWV